MDVVRATRVVRTLEPAPALVEGAAATKLGLFHRGARLEAAGASFEQAGTAAADAADQLASLGRDDLAVRARSAAGVFGAAASDARSGATDALRRSDLQPAADDLRAVQREVADATTGGSATTVRSLAREIATPSHDDASAVVALHGLDDLSLLARRGSADLTEAADDIAPAMPADGAAPVVDDAAVRLLGRHGGERLRNAALDVSYVAAREGDATRTPSLRVALDRLGEVAGGATTERVARWNDTFAGPKPAGIPEVLVDHAAATAAAIADDASAVANGTRAALPRLEQRARDAQNDLAESRWLLDAARETIGVAGREFSGSLRSGTFAGEHDAAAATMQQARRQVGAAAHLMRSAHPDVVALLPAGVDPLAGATDALAKQYERMALPARANSLKLIERSDVAGGAQLSRLGRIAYGLDEARWTFGQWRRERHYPSHAELGRVSAQLGSASAVVDHAVELSRAAPDEI